MSNELKIFGYKTEKLVCPECQGSGYIAYDEPCPTCEVDNRIVYVLTKGEK